MTDEQAYDKIRILILEDRRFGRKPNDVILREINDLLKNEYESTSKEITDKIEKCKKIKIDINELCARKISAYLDSYYVIVT